MSAVVPILAYCPLLNFNCLAISNDVMKIGTNHLFQQSKSEHVDLRGIQTLSNTDALVNTQSGERWARDRCELE